MFVNLGATATEQPQAQAQAHEEDAKYTYSRTLKNGESFDDLKINIETDSDFELTHVTGKWAQLFSMNFRTPTGRPLASSQVQPENMLGTAQFPVAFLRPMVFRAGSQISLSLTNLYAGDNAIELIFCGIRRYRTA